MRLLSGVEERGEGGTRRKNEREFVSRAGVRVNAGVPDELSFL